MHQTIISRCLLFSLFVITTCATGSELTSLHMAALTEDIDTILSSIEAGKNLSPKDEAGRTPLHMAADNGYTDILQLLIDNGADINAQDQQSNTPLYSAAESGHKNIVQLLINNGADINAQNQRGNTPLYSAAESGHKNIVQLLIDNGADINAQNQRGNTPLHMAADNGYTDILQLLIDNGADINAQDQRGNTPLYSAAYSGYTDIVQLLIDNGADINAQNQRGNTPLHSAAYIGHTDIVRLLIDNGADINTKGQFRFTPLRMASDNEIRQLIQKTEKSNALVRDQLLEGQTPQAIMEDGAQPTIVFEYANKQQKEQLLKEYSHILYNYLHNQEKILPIIRDYTVPGNWLLYAAQFGHINTLAALLKQDYITKKINRIQDKAGNRALHLAALYNQPEIAKKLLQRGSRNDINNNKGQTPYQIARKRYRKKFGQIIARYGDLDRITQQAERQESNIPPEIIEKIVRRSIT